MFIEAETPVVPAIVKPDKTLTILEQTLARVSNGWTQGVLHEDEDVLGGVPESFCLVGAVQWVDDYKMRSAAGVSVSTALRYIADAVDVDHYGDLTAWNDAPWREQNEVVTAIASAIARRREDLNMTNVKVFTRGGDE
jgi:hypothetical protein